MEQSLHGAESQSFSTRLNKYTLITGVEGSEKLKNCLTGLVCRAPFQDWIAPSPQDTLTWKMRELTPKAGSEQPSSSTAVCFSLENEKENHWSIAGP